MKRLASLFVVAGCLHSHPVEYTGAVRVSSPELVSINPDVKVVADADEPLFFASGSYWLFHDGAWYQGDRIGERWTEVSKPPVPVAQIDQPFAYTRYRRDHGPQTATTEPAQAEQQRAQPRPRRETLQF